MLSAKQNKTKKKKSEDENKRNGLFKRAFSRYVIALECKDDFLVYLKAP